MDPRLTLMRDGLAAASLEGVAVAARYGPTATMQCRLPVAGVRRAPARDAEQLDQLLFGERFAALEEVDGWLFGQALRDGYVGFVRRECLGGPGPLPTHRVSALRTFAFESASIKTPPRGRYSLNALVSAEDAEGRFVKAAGTGWIVREHLAPLGEWETDPAAVALRYLDAPYLWGGRDSLGLDCSGLVQQALQACGRAAPRDSDMQAALGVALAGRSALARNDLVAWRGHVGIMLDAARLLHANAHHMAVTVEPLNAAIARIAAAGGGEPTAFRRLPNQPWSSQLMSSQAMSSQATSSQAGSVQAGSAATLPAHEAAEMSPSR